MAKKDQAGVAQVSVLIAGLMSVLFVISLIFGLLIYVKKADLQKNIDTQVESKLLTETKKIEAQKTAEYAEKDKSPVKSYIGPTTFGSVAFNYPKNYSAYIIENASNSGTAIDGFLHPNFVPKDDKAVSFALRFQLISTSYDTTVKSYDSLIKTAKVTARPFISAKVPDVLGIRLDGEIVAAKQGSMIILPLRDKSLKIWTESKDTIIDFDKYVLPDLSFIP